MHGSGCLQRPKGCVGSPGAGVLGKGSCPGWVLGTELRCSEEQYALLTVEPSCQSVDSGVLETKLKCTK